MWKGETLEKRDRYHVLYGVSQALWGAAVVVSLMQAIGSPALSWVIFAVGAGISSVLWRRSWRKYRAATLAEIAVLHAQGALYAALLKARMEEPE